MLIAAMIVGPQEFAYPTKVEDITEEQMVFAQQYLVSDTFT